MTEPNSAFDRSRNLRAAFFEWVCGAVNSALDACHLTGIL